MNYRTIVIIANAVIIGILSYILGNNVNQNTDENVIIFILLFQFLVALFIGVSTYRNGKEVRTVAQNKEETALGEHIAEEVVLLKSLWQKIGLTIGALAQLGLAVVILKLMSMYVLPINVTIFVYFGALCLLVSAVLTLYHF